MTAPMLIAIDATEIAAMREELRALRMEIRNVQMTPRPEWLTVSAYAHEVGRTERTVRAWIAAGRVESRRDGNVLMVRR